MVTQIVILGGGTGGTLTANRLRRELGDDAEITVVDQDDRHVYQPGLLFVPFGLAHPEEIVRPRNRQLHDGIEFRQCGIDRVEITDNTVHLVDGSILPYDVLVVATGAALVPEETEGLTGPGWMEKVFTFYSLEGRPRWQPRWRLRRRSARRQRGRHADQVPGGPARVLLPRRLVLPRARDPRPGPDHVRDAARRRLHQAGGFPATVRHARREGHRAGHRVQHRRGRRRGGRLVSYDGREVPFDLAVVVPLHGGADYIGRSPVSATS